MPIFGIVRRRGRCSFNRCHSHSPYALKVHLEMFRYHFSVQKSGRCAPEPERRAQCGSRMMFDRQHPVPGPFRIQNDKLL
jgi:hypothetical protein